MSSIVPGKLILVSGYSGSGKTTMVEAALAGIPGLRYVRTVTTRAPRPSEVDGSYEYEFVSQAEYGRRRAAATHWNHFGVIDGQSYGANIDEVNAGLLAGVSYICSASPDEAVFDQMEKLYAVKPFEIWLDTSLELANARILAQNDPRRATRIHSPEQSEATGRRLKERVNAIFAPDGSVSENEANFVVLVQGVLKGVGHVN